MGSRILELKFLVDAAGLQKGFSKAGKQGEQFGKSVSGTVGLGLNKLKLGAIGAGLAVGGGLVSGLKGAVSAALEAEESQARLDGALRKVGASSDAFKAKVDSSITSLSNLTGFDDEDLTNAMSDLTRTTGDAQGSLKNMAAVADLARAKNIPLATAAKLVGRVMNGNTGALKKYGIELKKGATANEALAALQKKFGGAAKEYGETTKGSIDRAKVAFGNLQESVGKQLLPAIAAGAAKLAELLNKYGPVVQEKLGAAVDWVKEHWPQIKEAVVSAVQAIWPIVGPLLDNIKQGVKLIAAVISGDWDQAWQRVKNIVRNYLTSVKNLITTLAPRIAQAARLVGQFIWQKIKEGVAKLPGVAAAGLSALWAKVKEYAPRVGAAALDIGTRLLNRIKEKASELAGKVGAEVGKLPGKIAGFAGEVASAAVGLGGRILSGVVSGLAGLPGRVLELVKSAIRQGADWFNAHNSINGFRVGVPGFSIDLPDIPGLPGSVGVGGFGFNVPGFGLPDLNLAEGGIVRARPGGTIARIGEAGDDEAVIPLSRRAMRGIGLGGHTTIVHQHIAGSVVTERQLFDRWTAQLRVKTRREGATLAAGSVRTT